MDDLIFDLFNIKAIKFGEFKLKSGLVSPIYLDVREVIGYPKLINEISKAMYKKMSKKVDQICGVPYTALPIASCISITYDIPMVIKRKEMKDYGTKKLVEGVFKKDMSCCIIEDVITTGSSIIETANELRNVGLKVTEAIVLIDRGQGGRENISNLGITVKSVITLDEILKVLLGSDKITQTQYQVCKEFTEISQVIISVPKKISEINWKDRYEKSKNNVAKKVFEIVNTKKTNLCVAADVETMSELMSLARKIAPFICILKIHSDIIHDFDLRVMRELKEFSVIENFLLMEDRYQVEITGTSTDINVAAEQSVITNKNYSIVSRKFADIGNTVKLQLKNKHYGYLSWCDLVTVHGLPGEGILEGIKSAAQDEDANIGCLIVAEMSCKGSLCNAEYKNYCGDMALRHSDIVAGFITQSLVKEDISGFIHCTPGVKLEKGIDNLGQNYKSVSDLKDSGFVDIFIVGRGIIEAKNPDDAASIYRKATFYN